MSKKSLMLMFISALFVGGLNAQEIIHDAEQAILQKQFGDQWATQDKDIAKKLKALEKKFGKKPNIIHIMWDDNSLGEVGMPIFNKVKGFDTPVINKMADEGIAFSRFYVEPSCTPTRTAALTGRLAVRAGMYTVAFPPEGAGLNADEVTIAEVLSEAGYNTAFFAKAHQGDIEEAYMHNQGFDEAQFAMYNQFPPMFWHTAGERAGLTKGYTEAQQEKNYLVDKSFRPHGYIMDIKGKKGELAEETIAPLTIEDYRKISIEHQRLALDYIKRKANDDKPFYMAYWPNVYDMVADDGAEEFTTSHSTLFAQNIVRLDRYIGEVLSELKAQGISENTLVVINADNGPMHGIPGAFYSNIFRGGKGDFWEGGIRVPAFAVWPGVIEPNQVVGDMFAIHDLFTTFANIGGGTKYISTDRVIDGIDQTAVFLEGDGNSRRDYYHVYTGPIHAATIKQQFKRVWVGNLPGLVGNSFYDLYQDPRELHPMMAQYLWAWGPFDMVKSRHDAQIAEYPNRPVTHGIPFGGITNLRPETKKYLENYKDAFEIRMKK
jgi:arylsulfatase